MTAHEALSHPFVDLKRRAAMERERKASGAGGFGGGEAIGVEGGEGEGEDLLPGIKKNFNARRTLHAAIDTIRAINKLREGGAAGLMEGAVSRQPEESRGGLGPQQGQGQQRGEDGGGGGGGAMEGVEQTGSSMARFAGGLAGKLDPRGNARGQNEEMIRLQQKRVEETARGLWNGGGLGKGGR